MKKINLLFCILCIFGCQSYEVTPIKEKGHIVFSMTSSTTDNHGNGRTSSNLTPSAVLITIEDVNGNSVLQNQKLILRAMGKGYISETTALAEGEYNLVQFSVLNSNDTIIYAAPLKGSPLSHYVTNPLPLSFSVSNNLSTQITPQVVKVQPSDSPYDFGYLNFGFELINNLKSLVLFDYKYNDTLSLDFSFDKGRIKTCSWLQTTYGDTTVFFTENRFYDLNADIESIASENWSAEYTYVNEVLTKKLLNYNGSLFQRWHYLEYENNTPTKIKIEDNTTTVWFLDLKFTDGNITYVKSYAENEMGTYLISEEYITYTQLLNPLKSRVELPVFQPDDYSDINFYYSKNLPLKVEVTSPSTSTPKILSFEYTLDNKQRPISIEAIYSDITFQNKPSFRAVFGY